MAFSRVWVNSHKASTQPLETVSYCEKGLLQSTLLFRAFHVLALPLSRVS